MAKHKAALALALLLIVVQALGVLYFTQDYVAAQSNQLVAVIVGEKSRDACEVQYRRSTDGDNWGAQSIAGPPEACQGGLVTAYIVAEEEASIQTARAADAPGAENVSVVRLTGDPAADEAAIFAEMNAIHEVLDPDGIAEEDPLDCMSPGALATLPRTIEAPSTSILAAADCKSGRVDQYRRADVKFKSYNVGAVVQAYVYYKRISCAR